MVTQKDFENYYQKITKLINQADMQNKWFYQNYLEFFRDFLQERMKHNYNTFTKIFWDIGKQLVPVLLQAIENLSKSSKDELYDYIKSLGNLIHNNISTRAKELELFYNEISYLENAD